MVHAIPEPFCYDESFAVFYNQIDAEHRGLFDGVFACAGNRSDGGALTSLANLVLAHFAAEEATMEANSYDEFPAHKKLHDDFAAKLGTLATPLSDDTIHFAKNWLVQHIKNTDFKYKGKLG